MSCSVPYGKQLQALGYRMTPQRHAILHALKSAGRHLSPTEVYDRSGPSVPGLTEPTVYRTLEFLAEKGIIQSMLTPAGHLVYELGENHHEHLICRKCGREMDIDAGRLKKLFSDLEVLTGYQSIEGHITFMGLCPDCQ
jgi:Fe2+ or Zn2+ uptake regulation protein